MLILTYLDSTKLHPLCFCLIGTVFPIWRMRVLETTLFISWIKGVIESVSSKQPYEHDFFIFNLIWRYDFAFFNLCSLYEIINISASSQVSHHPMIVACHCEGTGWKFWGDSNLKSKFWGRSIQLDPVGTLTLEFDDGEVFQWSKVCFNYFAAVVPWFGFKPVNRNGLFLSGYDINIQSHIGKALLWSLWYDAYRGKPRVLL